MTIQKFTHLLSSQILDEIDHPRSAEEDDGQFDGSQEVCEPIMIIYESRVRTKGFWNDDTDLERCASSQFRRGRIR